MPEWLWIVLIGGVTLGLISLIYGYQSQRLTNVEKWKENYPMKEEVLTRSIHAEICKDTLKDVKNLIIDNNKILVKEVESLKQYLDLKIERDILVELRKLNNQK